MVRNYKSKTVTRWTNEGLLEAILCIRAAKLKINDAARLYGIPGTTLYREYQKFILAGGKCDVNQYRTGGWSPLLHKLEEDVLEKTIKDLRDQGFTVTSSDIKRICFECCDANGIQNKFNQEKRMASDAWYHRFLNRHPDLRLPNKNLLEALLCIKDAKLKIKDAARQYGIARATLYRQYQKFKRVGGKSNVNQFRTCGGVPILTKVEENALEKTIRDLRERGVTVTSSDIKRMCFEYCDSNRIANQFNESKRMASNDWYNRFLKRHPDVKIPKPRQTNSTSRASSIASSASRTSRYKSLNSKRGKLTLPRKGDVTAATAATKKRQKRMILTEPGYDRGKKGMDMVPYVPIDKEEEMIQEEIDSDGLEEDDEDDGGMHLGEDDLEEVMQTEEAYEDDEEDEEYVGTSAQVENEDEEQDVEDLMEMDDDDEQDEIEKSDSDEEVVDEEEEGEVVEEQGDTEEDAETENDADEVEEEEGEQDEEGDEDEEDDDEEEEDEDDEENGGVAKTKKNDSDSDGGCSDELLEKLLDNM
ncbi:unnamed protein product [Orchesella dallaii]|uniref:HTH CENPB-type domain-containing protein n=1 Tax=Orchesella dallaii TaxID=48710 RepID=A0ABP1PZ63_9HEXA